MDVTAPVPPAVSAPLSGPFERGRPVLTATVGPGSRPPARITAAIVAGLGEGAVEVVLSRRMTGGHADPAQREIGAHLSQGLSVLVHLVERTTGARRVLLDAAARHLASAVALVCGADNDAAAAFVAQLASEGWSAAVVLR